MDALHFTAEKYSATLDFQKGDIQYINNLSIFHARKGFGDESGNEYASSYPCLPFAMDVMLTRQGDICYDFGFETKKTLGKHRHPCESAGIMCSRMSRWTNRYSLWSREFATRLARKVAFCNQIKCSTKEGMRVSKPEFGFLISME